MTAPAIMATDAKPNNDGLNEGHIFVVRKMINERVRQLASCERMLELLAPEWAKFEARTGHDVYVARDYADHTSAARKHRNEIAALTAVLAIAEQALA